MQPALQRKESLMTNTKTNFLRRSCALLLAMFFAFSGFVGLVDFTIESEAASNVTAENYYANLDDNCDGKEFRANLAQLITNTHTTYTS